MDGDQYWVSWEQHSPASSLTSALMHFYINSHAVSPVVFMGSSKHAVSSVRLLLDVLEEIRWSEDAKQSWGSRGEDLTQSCKQCKLSEGTENMQFDIIRVSSGPQNMFRCLITYSQGFGRITLNKVIEIFNLWLGCLDWAGFPVKFGDTF